MRLIPTLLLILIVMLIFPSIGYTFDEDEIKELISGKTVHIYHNKKDVNFTRYFSEDGILIEEHPRKGFRKGEWNINGGKLCFSFEGGVAKCRPFIKKGGKYGTGNKKGSKIITVFEEIVDGNQIDMANFSEEAIAGPQTNEELVTIKTREDVSQTFLLMEPEGKPKGVVILYPGHEGVVRFNKIGKKYSVENEGGGITAHEKSRSILSNNGYAVAILAPPSDQEFGMDTDFRTSEEHANDAKMVIKYLRDKFDQDVYLHGHCRSSFSPASIATRLNNEGIKGVILSSTRSEGRHGSVMQLDKNIINVPVLLVHHKKDPCKGTPYKNIQQVKTFYEPSSPKVGLISVSGGDGARGYSDPGCSGGFHGFKGMRKPVMNAIVDWLDGNPFPENISE